MDPILGAILSAAFGGIFSSAQTMAANKYNSPKSQLRRLREAGLPQAFLYSGRVNTQSDVPSLSIDPDLGSVERENIGISKGQLSQTTRMNDEEIKRIAEEIRKLSIGNDISQGNLGWLKEEVPDYEGTGEKRTNQEIMLDMEKSIKNSTDWINKNKGQLSQIMTNVEDRFYQEDGQIKVKREELRKITQQIANLLSQDALLGQMYSIRSIEEVLNKQIGDRIETQSDFEQGLMWAIMQLFSKM